MILALLGMALASECEGALSEVRAEQSVAWVSPLRKRVGANTLVAVVSVASLKRFASKERLDTARMLQLLGLRKRYKAPRRRWKVTVFDASSGALCRPVAFDVDADVLVGLPICEKSADPDKRQTGCGLTRDRKHGGDGVELYWARWRDLAPRGFCVLPADRFAAEL